MTDADAYRDVAERHGLTRADPPPAATANGDGPASEAHGGSGRGPSQATVLTEIAEAHAELWHDPDGEAWATIDVASHQEHHRIRTRPFRTWLRRRYFELNRKAPGSQGVQDAVENLCGTAVFAGQERTVHVRVAAHDGAIYLDLADEAWRAVEVTARGWRVVDRPPVMFRRRAGMQPLPNPERGGRLPELRRFLNVTDEDWPLIAGWLAAAVTPFGPYPLLALQGRQGSAKTTAMRMLRRLIDPNRVDEREKPGDVRDLMIAATAGHVVSFDNLSGLPEWLSDALSRLATGAGFATRQLYSDDEEAIFAACSPVVANGIDDVATRPDLLDRSIVVALEPIADRDRIPERELWPAYDAARPRILGALLDVVACGLARHDQVELNQLPRMADFATWVAACAPALDIDAAEFLARYDANRAGAQRTAVEASLFAGAVIEFMEHRDSWTGTSSELLAALTTDERARTKGWPVSPRAVTSALHRLAPALEAAGVAAVYDRTASRRTWHLSKTGDASQRHERHKRHDPALTCDDAMTQPLAEASPDPSSDPAASSEASSRNPRSQTARDADDANDASTPTSSSDLDPAACGRQRTGSDDDGDDGGDGPGGALSGGGGEPL